MSMLARPRFNRTLIIAILALTLGPAGCDTRDPASRGRFNAFDTVIEVTLIGVERRRAAEIIQTLKADIRLMQQAWRASGPGPVAHVNQMFNAGSQPFAAPPSVLCTHGPFPTTKAKSATSPAKPCTSRSNRPPTTSWTRQSLR